LRGGEEAMMTTVGRWVQQLLRKAGLPASRSPAASAAGASAHVAVERESPLLIKVRLAGRLNSRQWRAALEEMAGLLKPGERASILVDADAFEGWGRGDWQDLAFQSNHDPLIHRMAIIADRKWEAQALMFAGKGLRRIEIEFFTPEQTSQARQWLTPTPSGASDVSSIRPPH
jgi:hypothetical protein